MRITLLSGLLFILSLNVFSQDNFKESPVSIPFFYGYYGYQWPGADMAERFGSNSAIGAGFTWKTSGNWIWGAEYDFLFGRNIDMGFDLLKGITNSDGDVINGDGVPAVIAMYERGNIYGVRFGKLFPWLSPNPNSGFFVTAGPGLMTHKIRIEVQNESAPQLKGDYKRGYDRFCYGFSMSQSIGYMFFGNSKLFNFYIAFEVFEAWTSPYRQYQFDTMEYDDNSRFEILYGPKAGWIIPLRKRMPKEYYYY